MKLNKLQEARLILLNITGVDINLCHLNNPVIMKFHDNYNLKFFENPYRLCPDLPKTFTSKPVITVSTPSFPCDHHRCWMKTFALHINITQPPCPDGSDWTSRPEKELCPQG